MVGDVGTRQKQPCGFQPFSTQSANEKPISPLKKKGLPALNPSHALKCHKPRKRNPDYYGENGGSSMDQISIHTIALGGLVILLGGTIFGLHFLWDIYTVLYDILRVLRRAHPLPNSDVSN